MNQNPILRSPSLYGNEKGDSVLSDRAASQEPVAVDEGSPAYRAGVAAKRNRIPLKRTALVKLRVGCQQYEDFLADYDGLPLRSRS